MEKLGNVTAEPISVTASSIISANKTEIMKASLKAVIKAF